MLTILVESMQKVINDPVIARQLSIFIMILGLILLAAVSNFLTKKIIAVYVLRFIQKTSTFWDNALYDRLVFTRLSHLIPIVIISVGSRLLFPAEEHTALLEYLSRFVSLYFVFVAALVLHSLLNALVDIYRSYEMSKLRPINSYVQVLKILLWSFSAVATVSILLNKDIWALFLGMSGMMAIIMLVFKDSILGLVAGVQITANDMLRLDDWLEMPGRGADGDVIEITLNTIKVRNWDKTITMIPTHALITESFKNWRGMTESGGRRIKRSISLDMNSVCFCNEEQIASFRKIQLLQDYLQRKQEELDDYNEASGVDPISMANGRRITNLGTFRAYLVAYLKNNPHIHQDMTFLVRQLAPGPKGVPIELYVFSNDQDWSNYEAIQADIFDHILAVIPEFRLRVFQEPTGEDFFRSLNRSAVV